MEPSRSVAGYSESGCIKGSFCVPCVNVGKYILLTKRKIITKGENGVKLVEFPKKTVK